MRNHQRSGHSYGTAGALEATPDCSMYHYSIYHIFAMNADLKIPIQRHTFSADPHAVDELELAHHFIRLKRFRLWIANFLQVSPRDKRLSSTKKISSGSHKVFCSCVRAAVMDKRDHMTFWYLILSLNHKIFTWCVTVKTLTLMNKILLYLHH